MPPNRAHLRPFVYAACALFAANVATAVPDAAILEKGKSLYNAAGSCVACHMPDGKGQPGSIPPLAGSDWLKGDPGRTIALSLRGLAGPVRVNGKKFYSAMPPQLLFDDAQLALMITYVNNAWGNKGPEVTASQVAAARKSLPPEVYTPEALLKAFPFEKSLAKNNGTFKPDYDDALTNITEPVVYRTFMPGASPAAFAVALPGNQFYCWDAGECRLRYVWTKGGFIRNNQAHWSSNGKPVAEFNGVPYYRARSSLLDESQSEFPTLAKTNFREPFYDTAEANDFPIAIEGTTGKPRFRGYRLIEGFPEFRYSLGKHEIRELIKATEDGKGVVRSFSIEPAAAATLALTPSPDATLTSSVGKIADDGNLRVSAEGARAFSVAITEKEPLAAGGAK